MAGDGPTMLGLVLELVLELVLVLVLVVVDAISEVYDCVVGGGVPADKGQSFQPVLSK